MVQGHHPRLVYICCLFFSSKVAWFSGERNLLHGCYLLFNLPFSIEHNMFPWRVQGSPLWMCYKWKITCSLILWYCRQFMLHTEDFAQNYENWGPYLDTWGLNIKGAHTWTYLNFGGGWNPILNLLIDIYSYYYFSFTEIVKPFPKPSILGKVDTRIYICFVLLILNNVYLFILLFWTPGKPI